MKESKLHVIHASQQNRKNSPCYRQKAVSRKGLYQRHHFPSLAFKHCKVSFENLVAVTCKCDCPQFISSKRAFRKPRAFCIPSFHPHSDPEDRRAEMQPKRHPKPSCRQASPRVHTQYILIKGLSLGLVYFWILVQLNFFQPAQTET